MARRTGGVHVATTTRVYKGRVYQTHLLRRSYREDGKVKHQTLGNLSHLPPDLIETIRRRLRGESSTDSKPWQIVRSFPHGHVLAVLGTLRSVGLESILASRASRESSLVIAMVVARILQPASKLATARCLQEETATTSLGLELGLGQDRIDEQELYGALDWLLERQTRIENKLAQKHLSEGTLILVRRVEGVGLQWVQIPPGNWVAPAGSYRSDAGRKRNRRSLRDKRVARRLGESTGRNASER
jgi:hypothetical protein